MCPEGGNQKGNAYRLGVAMGQFRKKIGAYSRGEGGAGRLFAAAQVEEPTPAVEGSCSGHDG